MSFPHEYIVVVPARQAYSHCDSVGKHRPNRREYLPIAGHSNGSGKSEHQPTELFPPDGSDCSAIARRGTQAVGITGHHRLVLGLGYLVFAEVKSFGQGDIVLGFIRSPTRFRGRAPHGKGARVPPRAFATERKHSDRRCGCSPVRH